jgi:hypothetical protein
MSGFAYTNLFAKSVPAPAVRFAGYPKYNFIGGHNDPTLIPVEGLIEAATSALRREGPNLAMYTAASSSRRRPSCAASTARPTMCWSSPARARGST